jgi:hypothetical protein
MAPSSPLLARIVTGIHHRLAGRRAPLAAAMLVIVAVAALISLRATIREDVGALLPDDRSAAGRDFALFSGTQLARRVLVSLSAAPGVSEEVLAAAADEVEARLVPPLFSPPPPARRNSPRCCRGRTAGHPEDSRLAPLSAASSGAPRPPTRCCLARAGAKGFVAAAARHRRPHPRPDEAARRQAARAPASDRRLRPDGGACCCCSTRRADDRLRKALAMGSCSDRGAAPGCG